MSSTGSTVFWSWQSIKGRKGIRTTLSRQSVDQRQKLPRTRPAPRFMRLRLANLALLILYPVAWFAPLLRAGLDLPLFGTCPTSL